jgi:tetratricopeptide (TPR) repeat protein
VRAIVERADGIPLYAVETVRMLLSEGRLTLDGGTYRPVGDLTTLAVPETLTALIGSRLDGLAPDDRVVVSDAAVLGQSFTLAGLAAVSGLAEDDLEPRLRTLVRRELLALEADPRSPERGQYSFVQALIREVAYNTLAKRDRKVRHLAAARFFEALGSDELAGALAGHYLAAYQNAGEGPEADALAAQAGIALRAAAERATDLGARAQAVTFLDQALAVTHDDVELADLLERAGGAALGADINDVAEDRLRRAVELRRTLDDPDALAGAIAKLGALLVGTLRYDAALALLEPVVDELIETDELPSGPGGVALLAQLSRAYAFHEEPRRCIAVADRALEAGERLDLPDIVSDVLITRGTALCTMGRLYEGTGALRAGIDLAEERGLVTTAIRGRANLGVKLDDPRASFDATSAALVSARRYGLRALTRVLVGNLAGACLQTCEWERAVEDLTTTRDETTDTLARNYLSWTLLNFGAWRGEDVHGEVARLTDWARTFHDPAALESIHDLDAQMAIASGDLVGAADHWLAFGAIDALNAPPTYLMAGLAALMAGDAARASAALAGHVGTSRNARPLPLDRRLIGAGLLALDGRPADALHEGRAVLAEYERMGLPWRQAIGALMLVYVAGGDEADVRDLVDTARAIFTGVGATPFLTLLDRGLAASTSRTGRPGRAPAHSTRDVAVESS